MGYTSKSVGLLLADRNKMFVEVAEEAKAAEARVRELQTAVQAADDELSAGTEELRVALEAAEALRSELETTRSELEASRESTREQEDLVAKLEIVLAQRDAELELARPAVAEADVLRSRLERVAEDLQKEEERASEQEGLAGRLRSDLERTRALLGSAQLEVQTANRRAEAVEARTADVDAELVSTRAELDVARHDVASLRLELDERDPSDLAPRAEVPGAMATAKEVSVLLHATEEAMARIIEEAKGRTDEELQEAERARAQVQGETERLQAWRDRVAPLVDEVRLTVEEARTRSSDLRDRIHEVLDPMTDAIMALGLRLGELDRVVATPPEPIQDVDIGSESSHVIELREHEDEADGLVASEGTTSGDQRLERPW